MSLPLVNLLSLALTAVSLVIFFAALRKANRLTAMSRVMAHQVARSAGKSAAGAGDPAGRAGNLPRRERPA